MLIRTVLNRIHKFKAFVCSKVAFVRQDDEFTLEVTVVPRANSRPVCSGCGQKRPGYDHLGERHFEFVPLWGIAVFFVYVMRRVDCPTCGVVVESVPWARGKHQLTTTYAWFLARWAKLLSWKEVSEVFQTSWEKVFSAVSMAVAWGLGRPASGQIGRARRRGSRRTQCRWRSRLGRPRLPARDREGLASCRTPR